MYEYVDSRSFTMSQSFPSRGVEMFFVTTYALLSERSWLALGLECGARGNCANTANIFLDRVGFFFLGSADWWPLIREKTKTQFK